MSGVMISRTIAAMFVVGALAFIGMSLGGCFKRDLLESCYIDVGVAACTLTAWAGCIAAYRRSNA